MGAVTVVLSLSAGGAASAQAAPTFHCEATPLRAVLAGTQSVEPITQGRTGDCTTGEAVPSAALPGLMSASALTAKTVYDAPSSSGTAIGALANLSVLPTPAQIAQLRQPVDQAIDQMPDESVTIPAPLSTVLALAGFPPTLSLDIRDAVRALVPSPGTALLDVNVLSAQASIGCNAGSLALSGNSQIAGVSVFGQDLGTDSVVDQALTVLGGDTIDASRLDVNQIHIATPLLGIDPVLLASVKQALVPLVAALPSIPLPASVIDVRLVPNEQTIAGSSLTQRALHASISLAGQPVLDAVLGEAKVSAADGTCAPAPAVATPRPAPAVKAKPVGTAGGQGVADELLACSDRKLVLVDVLKQGGRVKLLGAANRAYVGRRVAIRLRRTDAIVAHAIVRKDGSFETTAPMPARAVMASHTKANTLRYRAEIGKEVSLPLKLQRRLTVSSLTSKAGMVTIAGRVTRPLTTPVSTIRLVRRVSCHKVVLVKRFKPRSDGTFHITVKAPKGQAAAVYRLATGVREKPSNPRSYPTFSLPRGVALSTR